MIDHSPIDRLACPRRRSGARPRLRSARWLPRCSARRRHSDSRSSTGAQPSADWRAALTELKLAPSGDVVRKKRHMEVDATTADGRRVLVSFDLTGRVWEIEDKFHEKKRDGRPVDPAAAVQAVARAGFAEPAAGEVNHTVVRARTQKGEAVDLHVDRGGYIYKQIWVRP